MLFAAGCEEPMPENITNGKLVEVCIIADADADDDSRVSLNGNTTTWEVGDRITVALNAGFNRIFYPEFVIRSSSDISASGKRARFYGEVPTGEYYGVTALYPAVDDPLSGTTLDCNAADNIFMSSHIVSYDSPVLVVKEDKEVELPISFSHLMHKMDFNLSLADDYNSNDLNSNNIAVEISAVSGSNEVSFDMTKSFNMTTGTTSTTSTTKTILAYGESPQFSTMLFPMGLTRDVVFTFGVYIDGEKRYEVRKPDSGTIESIRMDAGRSTTVNLVLGNNNSISGGEDTTAEPITLKASKNTIEANGVDNVKLSVVKSDGGEDVTTQSTIYVNGSKLNGSTFLTTAAGTYTIRAERYGVESNAVTITAKAVASTGKTIVFAEGVTMSSGWYDVNKKGTGQNGDINMCWAAAASNMIQWFQDCYVAAGNKLPSTAINGPGTKSYGTYSPYELALMEVYHDGWNNNKGGHVEQAIPWYFEGKLNGGEYASAGSQAVPLVDGGYWKSIWSDVEKYMYCGYDYFSYDTFSTAYSYTVCYNNYYLWGDGSDLRGQDRLKYVSDLIVKSFNHGMASLTVSLDANIMSLHHAVTLWGYEIDNATGLLTRIWITDSDDIEKEPKTQLLNEYTVSIGSGNSHPKFTGNTRYGSIYLVSIHPFSGYGSADK